MDEDIIYYPSHDSHRLPKWGELVDPETEIASELEAPGKESFEFPLGQGTSAVSMRELLLGTNILFQPRIRTMIRPLKKVTFGHYLEMLNIDEIGRTGKESCLARISLDHDRIILGRQRKFFHEAAEIIISGDEKISRSHLLIEIHQGLFVTIMDLAVTNPTQLLNGKLEGKTILEPFAQIRIGDTIMRYVTEYCE